MSKNKITDSDQLPCKVISKYFSTEIVMDESLSDFQDKKPVCTHPKTIPKPKVKRPKHIKRIKGQKDIRTLVKKKNELITYSNEFGQICKQSDVDVDGEQLQLAIALSKSLHDTDLGPSNTSGTLTSQERAIKIRITLQEYGFKVPDVKINTEKRKKSKKQYKLLLISDSERQQIVSDKYAEVLLKNNHDYTFNHYCDNSQNKFYHRATNMSYQEIKNDDIFYVTNLFKKSLTKSCILRDWSEIPGRPVSPTLKINTFNFDDFECSQDELDNILSSSVKSAQDIVENIMNVKSGNFVENYSPSLDRCKTDIVNVDAQTEIQSKITSDKDPQKMNSYKEYSKSNVDFGNMSISNPKRGSSPDMFGDESEIDESNHILNLPELACKTNDKISFMDLTECVVPINTTKSIHIETIRKSNDFMETTICVSSSVQKNNRVDTIQTQNFENTIDQSADNDCIEIMNLTQSSDSNDLPAVHVGGTQNDILEDTVILDIDNDNLDVMGSSNLIQEPIDEDGINIRTLTSNISMKESEENEESNRAIYSVDINEFVETSVSGNLDKNNIEDVTAIDLTQSSESTVDGICDYSQSIGGEYNMNSELGKKNDVSIDYDEIYDNMVSNIKNTSQTACNITNGKTNNLTVVSDKYAHENVNLTSENYQMPVDEATDLEHFKQNINFGGLSFTDDLTYMDNFRIGKISNNINTNANITSNHEKITNSKHEKIEEKCSYKTPIKDIVEENNRASKTPNDNTFIVKTSNVTPILDYEKMSTPERNNELKKYGIKPFKRKRAIQLLTYIYNQTHPIVQDDITSPSKKPKFDDTHAIQMQSEKSTIDEENPKILNPKQLNISVSPIKKNALVSSQTDLSPVMLPLVDMSPSKPMKSPRKLSGKSPRKIYHSPRKSNRSSSKFQVNVKKDLYLETKQKPDIKEIYCDTEDWVFQKREKAKVHSCRVPLHIAFHNYVSCRTLLRDAILCYEPLNIDIVLKDLLSYGYRYNPKDLLKFLDKKCITVKTVDNTRNRKI